MSTVARDRLLAAALVAALVAHAILTKLPDDLLDEMLYACHVASVILAIGLVGRWRWLIAAGFLFHLGVGWVAWTLDVLDTHTTTPTSVLVHFLPLLSGFLVFRDRPLPRGSAFAAAAIYAALQPVSYWLTDPAHNVNLVHAPWPPLEPYFSSMALYRVAMCAIALAFVSVAELAFHRVRRGIMIGSARSGGGHERI